MNINDKLLKEIEQYCKLNNIDDVEGLINKMLKTGFDIEKFGPSLSVSKSKNTTTKVKKEINKENNSKEEKEDLYGE